MTRFVPVTVLVMVLAASRVASAQATGGSGSLPNGAAIVFEHRQIYDDKKNDGSFIEPQANSTELLHYFNLAHCTCAKANVGTKNTLGTFNYLVRETMLSLLHFGVDFWAGSTCDDQAHRTGGSSVTCAPISSVSIRDIDNELYPGGVYENFNLYAVVNANMTGDCQALDNANNSIFALMDTVGGSTNYNYSASLVVGTLTGETSTGGGVDTKPPPLPTPIKAIGGDGTIHLSWTPPTAGNTDIAYYQALCANTDGSPALKVASNAAQYVTTASLCPGAAPPASETLSETPITNSNELAVPAPDPTSDFGALHETYICGQSTSATANSLTIGHLDNGTHYKVILLSIDLHGNFTGTYFGSTITPVVSTDLWEDLHDRGSKTDGGLCLLAETYGDDSPLTNALRAFRDGTLARSPAGRWLTYAYYAAPAKLGVYVHGSLALRVVAGVVLTPVVVFALLWHWLSLPGALGLIAAAWLWHRRRALASRWVRKLLHARVVQGAAAIAVVALGAGRANAGGYQPYWEDSSVNGDENQSMADEPGLVDWHVGIRLGPYVPDIDHQLGGPSPGPYEQMFGNNFHILPMLDVDRILWRGFGQVGVGLSLGYMQKSARTFAVITTTDMDGNKVMTTNYAQRSGDTNKFRLIPTELTAIYRFTWLDDQYGVPVVPYARAGLAYYVWWISTPTGYARACGNEGMEPACGQNKARGASLGVTGAIGLAIRAERIDPSAATSMRGSGIQHAGLYGELSLAKVDGFGSDTKLSVGDRTWFAGVDFEF